MFSRAYKGIEKPSLELRSVGTISLVSTCFPGRLGIVTLPAALEMPTLHSHVVRNNNSKSPLFLHTELKPERETAALVRKTDVI